MTWLVSVRSPVSERARPPPNDQSSLPFSVIETMMSAVSRPQSRRRSRQGAHRSVASEHSVRRRLTTWTITSRSERSISQTGVERDDLIRRLHVHHLIAVAHGTSNASTTAACGTVEKTADRIGRAASDEVEISNGIAGILPPSVGCDLL